MASTLLTLDPYLVQFTATTLYKQIHENLKNQEKKPIPILPMYDSYRPIRELVRDVDDIDDRRFNGIRKNNYFPSNDNMDKGISEISKKIANIDINIEKRNNNPLWNH